MVAVAGVVAHAVVGSAGFVAAIEGFFFEEELGGMDVSSVYLIIYMWRAENMIDTLPLALETIGSMNILG